MISSHLVMYQVDDGTQVVFEIEPIEGYTPAGGAGDVIGAVRTAVEPAVNAAKEVLDRVRQLSPAGVEVKFGIKVTGKANWIVAKAATEGNFEVTLSWQPQRQVATAQDQTSPDHD